ncbi:MAG: thioredoxin family protein [Bacteroidia bacterium]|nr:thioredoxin family protein [Bacteroidia bacterium]
MLRTLLLLFSLAFCYETLSAQKAIWYTDFEQAKTIATQQDLPILMVFSGSDWCKPCMKLNKEVFAQPLFIEAADTSFVLLEVDFPASKKHRLSEAQLAHNSALADTYNEEGGFPLVLLLTADGEVIATTGYEPGGPVAYLQHLQSLLAKYDE